jgi:hypothetical protein
LGGALTTQGALKSRTPKSYKEKAERFSSATQLAGLARSQNDTRQGDFLVEGGFAVDVSDYNWKALFNNLSNNLSI